MNTRSPVTHTLWRLATLQVSTSTVQPHLPPLFLLLTLYLPRKTSQNNANLTCKQFIVYIHLCLPLTFLLRRTLCAGLQLRTHLYATTRSYVTILKNCVLIFSLVDLDNLLLHWSVAWRGMYLPVCSPDVCSPVLFSLGYCHSYCTPALHPPARYTTHLASVPSVYSFTMSQTPKCVSSPDSFAIDPCPAKKEKHAR